MGTNPKFLTKNLITSTAMFTATSGTAQLIRMIDRSTETQWATVGETSGSRILIVTFSPVKQITRLIFQGINWKDFTIHFDGVSVPSDVAITNNTETDLYYEISTTTVTSITVTVLATITSGEEMKIAEFYCGTELFEMTALTGGVKRIEPESQQKIVNLADGSCYKIFIKKLFGYALDLQNITAAERLNYLALYNRNKREPFYFIPTPATSAWDGVGGHVNWVNAFDFDNRDGQINDNNYSGHIELKQAGGL